MSSFNYIYFILVSVLILKYKLNIVFQIWKLCKDYIVLLLIYSCICVYVLDVFKYYVAILFTLILLFVNFFFMFKNFITKKINDLLFINNNPTHEFKTDAIIQVSKRKIFQLSLLTKERYIEKASDILLKNNYIIIEKINNFNLNKNSLSIKNIAVYKFCLSIKLITLAIKLKEASIRADYDARKNIYKEDFKLKQKIRNMIKKKSHIKNSFYNKIKNRKLVNLLSYNNITINELEKEGFNISDNSDISNNNNDKITSIGQINDFTVKKLLYYIVSVLFFYCYGCVILFKYFIDYKKNYSYKNLLLFYMLYIVIIAIILFFGNTFESVFIEKYLNCDSMIFSFFYDGIVYTICLFIFFIKK